MFFVDEVTGHFDERVYKFATSMVPPSLNILLNTISPLRLLEAVPAGFNTLDEQLEIIGESEALKKAGAVVPNSFDDYDAAIKHLKKAIRVKKNEDRFYHLLGASYLKKGKPGAARRCVRETGTPPRSRARSACRRRRSTGIFRARHGCSRA